MDGSAVVTFRESVGIEIASKKGARIRPLWTAGRLGLEAKHREAHLGRFLSEHHADVQKDVTREWEAIQVASFIGPCVETSIGAKKWGALAELLQSAFTIPAGLKCSRSMRAYRHDVAGFNTEGDRRVTLAAGRGALDILEEETAEAEELKSTQGEDIDSALQVTAMCGAFSRDRREEVSDALATIFKGDQAPFLEGRKRHSHLL